MSKKQQPKRPKHIPQRTCIVCREKRDKRRLTRIVNTPDAGVIVDPTGKQNGRGAYVCDQSICWDKIIKTTILNQALKTEVTDEEKAAINKQRPIVEVG
jgi:predicted RNA-binding protein YlxR (DUF448 family)